jgi:hypothetical protein
MRLHPLALIVALSLADLSLADSRSNNITLEALARRAISGGPEAAAAVLELRAQGQPGLDALLHACTEGSATESDSHWKLVSAALDKVAAQRDAYYSRLYWFTDIDQAKAAARASNKPILSLRMLGKLDEDLSCANSRFFRLTLYSNSQISQFLRDNFILHWESVRPVPRMTIDFGDGRKLERTITGNSIHYVLDAEGRAIDALPGVYGPGAFLLNLERAGQFAAQLRGTDAVGHQRMLREYHTARLTELNANWNADLKRAGVTSPPRRDLAVAPQDNPPTAVAASRRAISKMVVAERPLLRGVSGGRSTLQPTTEDAEWAKIAALYAQYARLDDASRALIRSKNPSGFGSAEKTESFLKTIANLERVIAEDTARNRYTFETTLHQWFLAGGVTKDLRALNEKVYTELFLTPSTDPWLGLFPADSYIGIDDEGVRK